MSADVSSTPLQASALGDLGGSLTVPTYDRAALQPSVVHIGVGGFHRAHFATYVDDVCAMGRTDWSIVGAGILDGDRAIRDALRAQDHLYSLITRGPDRSDVAVIGSIVDFIGPRDPKRLITQIADPATQIVSLTVTEGGYPVDDETGRYLRDSIAAGPRSAFGRLAAGLAMRRHERAGPITVLSFDNIMSNGSAARAATLGEASAIDPSLVEWIDEWVSFPNSMVDRITPATTPADTSWLEREVGLIDRWPVVTEPFRQWVIEDRFAGRRLPLEDLDVIVTADVGPYEVMKLRLLNAGHSCLAYLAALADIETVHGAMEDDEISAFVAAFLELEAKPAVQPVAGIDLDAYTSTLLGRFSNPQIGDQISRLCLDGSAKFPKFLVPTIRAQLHRSGPVALSALAMAGWCEYLRGRSESGAHFDPSPDPALDTAIGYSQRSVDDPAAFLGFAQVFGDLAQPGPFRHAFVGAVEALRASDVRSAIRSMREGVDGGP